MKSWLIQETPWKIRAGHDPATTFISSPVYYPKKIIHVFLISAIYMSYRQHHFHASKNAAWTKIQPFLFLIQPTVGRGRKIRTCSAKAADLVCLHMSAM